MSNALGGQILPDPESSRIAAKVRRDHLEYKLRQLETELRGKAREKLIEARLWLLEGDG